MSPVHVHLALNHIPVLFVPLVVLLCLKAAASRRDNDANTAHWLLLLCALIIWPIYWSGSESAVQVGSLQIDSDKLSQHQEWALLALALTTLLGLAVPVVRRRGDRWVLAFFLVIGVIDSMVLCYVAWLGGCIRHLELGF